MEYLIDPHGRSQQSSDKRLFQRRYRSAVLGLIVMFMMTALRINLGIAMVAMVNHTTSSTQVNYSNQETECPAYELYNSTTSELLRGEFLWTPELQGYIQSAGYWGMIIFQLPAGILSRKFGAKRTLIWSELVAGLSNLLSPVAARFHPYILFGLSLLRGMSQAALPPSISILSAKWFPRTERGFLSATIYCGFPLGALLTALICGILCDLEFMDGWPLVFYTFGFCSIIVAFLFYYFFYDTPKKDPWISKAELDHIKKHQDMKTDNTDMPTPWFQILTTPHTHIFFLAMFGQLWIQIYFLSVHPLFLGTVLHVPIKKNGALSGFPFIAAIIASWVTCWFSYWITNHGEIGVTALRKGMNSLSCFIFAAGMIGIYFAKCNLFLNEIFMYVTISSNGVLAGGSLITAPDMSPTFCGPLTGYVSTMASFAGVVATVMVGYLTNDGENLTQWGKIFLVSAGVSLGTGLLYLFFGSAEIQPWDPAFEESPKEEKHKKSGIIRKESTNF